MNPRIASHGILATSFLLVASLGGCSLFSTGIPEPDRSSPVALIELRGHPARLGATTTEGVLFLREPDAKGACRVHYFLGSDLIVEDGTVVPFGDVYAIADIDLKTQAVPVLMRDPTPEDDLVALTLEDGAVLRTSVELADDPIVQGYALRWPGHELAAGTGIFRVRTGQHEGALQFVGLASGIATLQDGENTKRFITFTGPARIREAIALPQPILQKKRIKYRPDGIYIRK